MRRRIAGGAIALVLTAAGMAAATPPASPFDSATWTKSQLAVGYKFGNPLGFFFNYSMLGGQVSIRGPEGNPTAIPRVGERFYVRTSVVWFTHPWLYTDTYKTSVLLPEGVTPSIGAADDVICAVTTTDDATVRIPGPAECQDPAQVGVMWEFPSVSLDEGQVAQFWFPVVSSRPYNGEAGVQMLGRAVANPGNVLPNPVVAEVPLFVAAAAPAGATTPPVSGGPISGGTGTGTTTTPLAGVVTKPTGSGLLISWVPASAAGVTGYRVQVRLLRATKWVNAGTTAGATTFRWKKAKRGKRYQVRVAAIIGGVVGAWSKPVTVTAR